jgi:hypothetical protein
MCTLSLAKHFHILQIIHANLTVLISQYNNHLRNNDPVNFQNEVDGLQIINSSAFYLQKTKSPKRPK